MVHYEILSFLGPIEMFAEELLFGLWMLAPILLGFVARIWLSHRWWDWILCMQLLLLILISTFKYTIPLTDFLAFPVWTGILESSATLLAWILYGYATGKTNVFGPRFPPFVFGMFCGAWASTLRFEGKSIALCLALSGALLGRMGLPVFLLLSPPLELVPLSLLLGVFLGYMHHRREGIVEGYAYVPLCTAALVWLLAWWNPFMACFFGLVCFWSQICMFFL